MDPIQEQLEAYNAHDIERFVACFSDNAEMRPLDGEAIKGHTAIRERYGAVFAASAPHCTLIGRLRAGPWTIDEEQVSFDGGTRLKRALVAFEVADGRIARMLILWSDTPASGAHPPAMTDDDR
jgi:hypothetical protein